MTTPEIQVLIGCVVLVAGVFIMGPILNRKSKKRGKEKGNLLCQGFSAIGIEAIPFDLVTARETEPFVKKLLDNYVKVDSICALKNEEFNYVYYNTIDAGKNSYFYFQYVILPPETNTIVSNGNSISGKAALADSLKASLGLSKSRRRVRLASKKSIALWGKIRDITWNGEEHLTRELNEDNILKDKMIKRFCENSKLTSLDISYYPRLNFVEISTAIIIPDKEDYEILKSIAHHVKSTWFATT